MKPSALLEGLAKRAIDREKAKPGPVVWCKHCSRRHPRRQACKLFYRTRVIDASKRRGRRAGTAKTRTKRWAA